jgi:hypothetical protein
MASSNLSMKPNPSLINGKWQKLFLSSKKGDRNNIQNYRPIANLCSSSKIFEKPVLKRINRIQSEN